MIDECEMCDKQVIDGPDICWACYKEVNEIDDFLPSILRQYDEDVQEEDIAPADTVDVDIEDYTDDDDDGVNVYVNPL
jgi:hypothetical protein